MFPSLEEVRQQLLEALPEVNRLRFFTIFKYIICIVIFFLSPLAALLIATSTDIEIIYYIAAFLFFAGILFSIIYGVKSGGKYRDLFKEKIVFGTVKYLIDHCKLPDATEAYPTLFESLKKTQMERVYNDLIFFFGIIEEFHLNRRIWSKYQPAPKQRKHKNG
ncbi:hypothetical protein J9303_17500 [Bacillaceae bacterium Marseille-Q3522]|nr:hypothetical protein [Bacillaceae bacterium Marseille-Q3522]